MRVFTLMSRDDAPLKCGGCNWRVDRLYVLAETAEEAFSLYRRGEAGLCGDCFGSMLSEMESLRIDGRGETIKV